MTRHLVLKHLENVSGDLLAEHGDLLAHYAKGRCGVYVLYSKGRMYYVGLASNLSGRLKSHLKDRHKGGLGSIQYVPDAERRAHART